MLVWPALCHLSKPRGNNHHQKSLFGIKELHFEIHRFWLQSSVLLGSKIQRLLKPWGRFAKNCNWCWRPELAFLKVTEHWGCHWGKSEFLSETNLRDSCRVLIIPAICTSSKVLWLQLGRTCMRSTSLMACQLCCKTPWHEWLHLTSHFTAHVKIWHFYFPRKFPLCFVPAEP